MKYIKYSILFTLLLSVLFSCKENEDLTFRGQSVANFAKSQDIFYVSSNPATYDILVGVLNPATEDMNIPISLVRQTDKGSRITIPGLNNGKINLSVKKGDTFGKITLTSSLSKYANEVDTLTFVIDDPLFGRKNEDMLLYGQLSLRVRRLCPLNSETLKATWDGAILQEKGVTTYEMGVTYLAGDTLLISNFYDFGIDAKVKIDLNTVPYQTSLKPNTLLWDDPDYGRVLGQNRTSANMALRGVLDDCDGLITVLFGMQIPDYANGNYWFSGYETLTMVKK